MTTQHAKKCPTVAWTATAHHPVAYLSAWTRRKALEREVSKRRACPVLGRAPMASTSTFGSQSQYRRCSVANSCKGCLHAIGEKPSTLSLTAGLLQGGPPQVLVRDDRQWTGVLPLLSVTAAHATLTQPLYCALCFATCCLRTQASLAHSSTLHGKAAGPIVSNTCTNGTQL